ncbi:PREDICTED: uncharacterized protein LOC105813702 [Propithecus coquereli]|uniref:uncharacterized protein LOC105813702 n=1 Tax=Propithecus coquereli TaxID=379532 RepID=UPI00063F7977|nr:PREDICTED: uncharacterized protein LOC105813702 [Propithecus coquereli]
MPTGDVVTSKQAQRWKCQRSQGAAKLRRSHALPRRVRVLTLPLPGRRGRPRRRRQQHSPLSGLWSQLVPGAARRQEAAFEWGPLPRQDVAGLGRRRRDPQKQLVPAVPAPSALQGGGPRRQGPPGMAEFSDIWKLFKHGFTQSSIRLYTESSKVVFHKRSERTRITVSRSRESTII